MKLDQITLENFGIYKRRTFEFGGAPLVLVYGANEAGKTTALNGLRQSLFGFRLKTPYLTGAPMSAEIAATLKSGDRLQFTRRKARQDDVVGHLELAKVDAAEVSALLGGLDLDSYENLFGFSQDELRRGQDTLKSAKLTEALAGGSLGGIHTLEQLRADLSTSLEDLYKPRGSKSQINVLLSELHDLREKRQEHEVLPSQVQDLRKALRDALRTSADLKRQYDETFLQRSDADRLLEALPLYAKLRAAEYELSQIDIPEGIDANFVTQWGDYADQRKTLHDTLTKERNANQADQAELALLDADGQLFEHESELEHLGTMAESCPRWRERLEELRLQIAEGEQSLAGQLESLRLEAVTDAVTEFSLSIPVRQELEELSKQHATNAESLVSVNAKLDAAEQSLRELNASLADEPVPGNRAELAALVDQLVAHEAEANQQSRTLDTLLQNSEYKQLVQRVTGILESAHQLEPGWKLPSRARVEKHLEKQSEAKRQVEQIDSSVQQLQQEIEKLTAQSHESEDPNAASILQRVESLSEQRNGIIRHWLDELTQPLIAASLTPDQQEERLCELDRIGKASDQAREELLAIADTVAAASQQRKQLQQRIEQLAALRQQHDEALRTLAKLDKQWTGIWKHCPVTVLAGEPMVRWSQDYQTWCAESDKRQQMRRALQIARSSARTVRSQLMDAWPSNLRDSVAVEALRDQTMRWENTEQSEKTLAHRKRSTADTIEQLKSSMEDLQTQQASIVARFEDWLRNSPVADDQEANWTIREVTQLMDGLSALKREHFALRRAQSEYAENQQRIEEFESRVSQVEQQWDSQPVDLPPENKAIQWREQLRSQREDKTKHIRLASTIAHRTSRMEEMQTRLQSIDTKLAALCATTESIQVGGVEGIMEQVRDADRLRQEIGKLKASLNGYCKADELDTLIERLRTADEASLLLERRESDRSLQTIESERTKVHQQIGSLEERIEQLANSKLTRSVAHQIQSKRGELADLAEQWIVERMARELLSRSIDLFASENEPALLKHTRVYLAKLTGGRYVDLEHDQDKKGMFSVLNSAGERFEPDRLSTGTREQLYLAIRMAYIKHHCEESEPLPAVMDDCFVNFDDDRTKLALEALCDWDDAMQAIVLSCHSRVPKLVAEIAPHTPLIDLANDRCTSVHDFVTTSSLSLT